ncbi:hypothetical protein LV779_26505 [Streptomyces thinghirensis]|nr:hypothetical protein [Streptomyces thinghirensis]
MDVAPRLRVVAADLAAGGGAAMGVPGLALHWCASCAGAGGPKRAPGSSSVTRWWH